ncbi:MAG: cation-transporting P-type ATPase, partial [Cyclobacteriaceae bacterium]|nr:cation-transporting P-type ATPase [Cyclobacteriaceae bacterium]
MYDVAEYGIHGLTAQQVSESRAAHGRNEVIKEESNFLEVLKDLLREPMLLLLLVAALLYFLSGEIGDGIFMTSAIVIVTSISLYQESRSRNALAAL